MHHGPLGHSSDKRDEDDWDRVPGRRGLDQAANGAKRDARHRAHICAENHEDRAPEKHRDAIGPSHTAVGVVSPRDVARVVVHERGIGDRNGERGDHAEHPGRPEVTEQVLAAADRLEAARERNRAQDERHAHHRHDHLLRRHDLVVPINGERERDHPHDRVADREDTVTRLNIKQLADAARERLAAGPHDQAEEADADEHRNDGAEQSADDAKVCTARHRCVGTGASAKERHGRIEHASERQADHDGGDTAPPPEPKADR